MQRVISYVDGFNLYFGIKSKGWRKYYWLDLAGMCRGLLKPGQTLGHCHYFTARIRTDGRSQDARRQAIWLDALATRADITCHLRPLPAKAAAVRRLRRDMDQPRREDDGCQYRHTASDRRL